MKNKFLNHEFLSITSICFLSANFIVGLFFLHPLLASLVNQGDTARILLTISIAVTTLLNLFLIVTLACKYIYSVHVAILFWLIQVIQIDIGDWGLGLMTGISFITRLNLTFDSTVVSLTINWISVIAIVILVQLKRSIRDSGVEREIIVN